MKTFRGVQFLVLVVMLLACAYGVWQGVYRLPTTHSAVGEPRDVWFGLGFGVCVLLALTRTVLDIVDEEELAEPEAK